ncbi:Carcinoembryonic antigen-related cell adhesion molecule 3 [Varanus komodoensis]|uniref:carcinoembryonic antigen-related cell adhesion molecule 4-like n=1 Tax=Varanus komodoensis TaxID=61221 RepID=UPI001CF7B833|nr:carcinoembryonic antigen-related cell adhesion molecule 4-like [Varanus komodoensis]KAF7242486.1 Carcinoembryonic antigen-related cell adhesion molecule 3 [Varanus komodoensis]
MTLRAGGTLEKVVLCSWFRGTVTDVTKRIFVYYLPPLTQGQVNGPSYTGRETAGPDCSLHIRNLTLNDSGNYTLSKVGAVTAVGHVTIEFSVPVQDNSSSHPVLVIIVSLAATLALIGSLHCFFLCARCQKKRMSTQANTVASLYENVPASRQVKKGNSSEASNIYETLQPGGENVYNELKS